MRIALCISGEPRRLSENIKNLMEGLVTPSGITDVFIHSWFDEKLVGESFYSAQPGHIGNMGTWDINTVDLLHSLNPKKIIIEPHKSFNEYNHLDDLPSAIQTRLVSNFYSVYMANKLKCEYEEEHGFKYDLVIKTRIDCKYHKPHNITKYVQESDWNEYVHVPTLYQKTRVSKMYPISTGGEYGSLSDTFAFGTSEIIDKFSSVFLNVEYIYLQIKPFQYGECYFGYQTRYHSKIPVRMKDITYNLNR